MFPIKSINNYSYDITGGKVKGYKDYTKEIANISHGRINRYLFDLENTDYQKISQEIMKYIFLFGPINFSVQAYNFEAQTRNIDGTQYYSYEEFNKDSLNWQKGIISDKDFNNKYDNKETNHVVYCVGWKTNKLTGKRLWIIKNSWGTGWGDNGYFYVPMGINASAIEIHPDFMVHEELLIPYFKKNKENIE